MGRIHCSNCGKLTNQYEQKNMVENPQRFCSAKCKSEFSQSKKVEVTCLYCGKKHFRVPSKIRPGRKFCNRECRGKYQTYIMEPWETPAYRNGNKGSTEHLAHRIRQLGIGVNIRMKVIYGHIVLEQMPLIRKLTHREDFRITCDSKVTLE